MEPWRHHPRNPMGWISPKTFFFQFPSLCYASGRKFCYLCFQVGRGGHPPSDWGVFRNKVHRWAPYHAESCFLSWFRAQNLSPDEDYHVTWFSSWSPCHTCADEVVEFLGQYRHVTLSIFAARLYYFWDPPFQNGLRRLQSAGVRLDIMSFADYKHCWKNFVDHKGMRFQSRNLLRHRDLLASRLENILRIGFGRPEIIRTFPKKQNQKWQAAENQVVETGKRASSRGETGTIWVFDHRANDPINILGGKSEAGPHGVVWTKARREGA